MRVLKQILLFCLALALLLPGASKADGEGYAMTVGEAKVYLDHDLTRRYGTLGDSSLVYVAKTQSSGGRNVYTLIFGVDGILRIGYADAGDLMPVSEAEGEMYASAGEGTLLYNGRIRLLNCPFLLDGVTATPAPTAVPAATPVPTAAPAPAAQSAQAPQMTLLPQVTFEVTSSGGITILIQPQDVYVFNGEEFVLAVAAEGAVSFQWQYFDGEEWKDSVMSQATLSAMELVAFTGVRERIYRCALTGRDGTTVYTREAHIHVQ